MTDTVSSSNDSLESLLAQYEAGVSSDETSDIISWLNARGDIESRYDELTPEQSTRLENADSALVEKAGPVAARLAATPGGSLRELRQSNPHPSEQWWWYLDVLSHVSDHYEAGADAKPGASTASRLLTVVELVVLAVAIYLLVVRLLPPASAPAATPFPTVPPVATATLDANAYDLSTAATFKAPNDVIEILVPKAWKTPPSTQSGQYAFYYGDDQNPTTVLQISIGTPLQLSAAVGSAATPPSTPQDLLQAFHDAFQSQVPPNATFTTAAAVKLGKLDGTGFTLSVPDSAQQPGVNLEVRTASLPDGKAVLTFARSDTTNWAAAKPAIDKMLDSLVVNASAIPTATPTPSPIPLELTATALQQQAATVQAQILALTPSPTASPMPSPLPTQQATGAATVVPTKGS